MEFKIEKISELIYKISEPYFYEHANIFVFKGTDFDLIVDSGVGLENLKKFTNESGFTNVKLFLTHAHFDHCGGVKYFEHDELLIKQKTLSCLDRSYLLGVDYLSPNDFNQDITSKLTPNLSNFCSNFNVSGVNKIHHFESDFIKNGIFSFEIILAPGHTDDSYMLFDKEKQLLVTGDVLYDGAMYATMPNSNKISYLKSLQDILNLDFNLILPGHNQIMDRSSAIKVIERWINEL